MSRAGHILNRARISFVAWMTTEAEGARKPGQVEKAGEGLLSPP